MNVKHFSFLFILLLSSLLLACQNQQFGAREKGALGGGALGAGLGAIIGNQSGNPGAGVAIGSAFGAIAGGLMGNEVDKQQAEIDRRQEQIDAQDRQIEENRKLLAELKAKGVDARVSNRGIVINLPDVLFAYNSADLTSSAQGTVKEIAAAIGHQAEGRRIAVEGHADSTGSESYNQTLSQNRARSVADELNENGLAKSNMSVRGFGEKRPIASNDSESGRQRNRRVEVIVENS